MSNKFKMHKAKVIYEKLQTTDESTINEEELLRKNKGSLKKVWEKVQTLYVLAKEKNIPVSVKAIAIGALAYVILPIDAIPDITPIFGYIDDAAVVGFAMFKLKDFLESPIGQQVVSKSSRALKKTIKKAKVMYKGFSQSKMGKEVINAVKAFAKDTSEMVIKEVRIKLFNALEIDPDYGFSYFNSEKGEAFLDVEGKVFVDAVESDYLDESIDSNQINGFKTFIEKYGREIVIKTIDLTLATIKELVKKKIINVTSSTT